MYMYKFCKFWSRFEGHFPLYRLRRNLLLKSIQFCTDQAAQSEISELDSFQA